jgi:hypothetical protein
MGTACCVCESAFIISSKDPLETNELYSLGYGFGFVAHLLPATSNTLSSNINGTSDAQCSNGTGRCQGLTWDIMTREGSFDGLFE